MRKLSKLTYFFGSIFFAISCMAQPTAGKAVRWLIEDGGNGHWYEIVGNYDDPAQRWDWPSAKAMAEGRGGHLVTITSQGEQDFVAALHAKQPKPTWIGLTDNEKYGGHKSFGLPNPQTNGWVWVTGEPVIFTSWLPGAPDQTQANEDAALIGSQSEIHHLWNDAQLTDTAPFMVEFDEDLFIRVDREQIQILWRSASGSAYRIEQSNDLKNWTPAAKLTALSDLTVFAPVLDGTKWRFFRLAKE